MYSIPAMAEHKLLTAEPLLTSQHAWDIYPNRMLVVSYDTNHNGRPDYFTLRVIVEKLKTAESVRTVALRNAGRPVFTVNYGAYRSIYITTKKPLFYAIDVDEDGIWDIMYKDVSEDGVNGNEEFYDSPSGKFRH